MGNRDKEIRKLMTERGFDSFNDLSERLNQCPETDSYEDVVAELAELKMQLINPQPLFTLTAEEVEIVRFALAKRQYQLGNLLTSWEKEGVDESDKEFEYYRDQYNKEQPILTRIKQWQDENNRTD